MGLRLVQLALTVVFGLASTPGLASEKPYAGWQEREIKALSQSDVDDLLAGRGWGFAKPAELNGYPGPAHVLDLKRELALSPEQVAAVDKVFQAMRRRAIALGRDYVEAERDLEAVFAGGTATSDSMARHTLAAERLRAALRQVHLEAHLLTRPLLTAHQLTHYQRLRGYAGSAGHKHAH